jgi:membrane associated rhomboid family serine protease
MGLADRDYTRAGAGELAGGRPGWSANTWIIAINLVIFGVMWLFGPSMPAPVLVQSKSWDPDVYEVYPAFFRGDGSPVAPGERLKYGEAYFRTLINRAESKRSNAPVWVGDPGTGRLVVAEQYLVTDALTAYGHFSTFTGFVQLQVWRLVSFQFLHASLVHVAMNMFGLYIFGPPVEEHLGRKKYLAFYLVCGIFGGLAYLFLNLLGHLNTNVLHLRPLPGVLIDDIHTTLVGASAGVFGVIMACARLRPDERVQLLFPPVSLPMRMMAFAYVGIAAVNLLFRGRNAGGEAAHIGGALAGFYFILRPHLLTDFFDIFGDSRRPPKPAAAPPARPPSNDRLDAILDKVRREGRQSLTDEERAFLHEQTEKFRTRER